MAFLISKKEREELDEALQVRDKPQIHTTEDGTHYVYATDIIMSTSGRTAIKSLLDAKLIKEGS